MRCLGKLSAHDPIENHARKNPMENSDGAANHSIFQDKWPTEKLPKKLFRFFYDRLADEESGRQAVESIN